jgi:NAD(P)-dependent dehydrogenase (short-subunit alcohol dehydrogenase family)
MVSAALSPKRWPGRARASWCTAATLREVAGRRRDREVRWCCDICQSRPLASLAEVRLLAGTVQDTNGRLGILINNAGIGTAGGVREESADGFELRFAVNYLAGFLLTSLLLPLLLRASAPARVVNVSQSTSPI